MNARVHPELMSKARLVAEVRNARAREAMWRRAALRIASSIVPPEPVQGWTDESATWAEARRILSVLPADPDAQEHLDVLRAEVNHPKGKPFEHGTLAGHRIHERRGEFACEPCMEARRAYARERRAVA